MKIVKSYEESGLLIKVICETIKNEPKEQEVGLLSKLLGTLAANLWGYALRGRGVISASKDTIGASENFWCRPIL